MNFIQDPHGMHPGLKKTIDKVLNEVNGLVDDIKKPEGWRKRRTTWKGAGSSSTTHRMYVVE
jgi:hypothetical protein